MSALILFGSHARGVAAGDSDLDVLVVSSDFGGKDIFDRSHLISDAERRTICRFNAPMDVIALTLDEYNSATSPVAAAARAGGLLVHTGAT